MKNLTALLLGVAISSAAVADTISKEAGRAVGQFGAGVGEVITQGMNDGLQGTQPQWETIQPRSKEDCFKDTGGVIDKTFMHCRNGWQEFVRYDSKGRRSIVSERPIPNR